MPVLAPTPQTAQVEATSRSFWKSRRLPATPVIPTPSGTPVHLIFGVLPGDRPPDLPLLQRVVVADAQARALTLGGRVATGPIPFALSPGTIPPPSSLEILDGLGLWVGPFSAGPVVRPELTPVVERMLGRLAAESILVCREDPVRICPRCNVPRSPATIIYEEEEGPAFLVRFPLRGADPPTSLLVWVDSAWKLLGTIAVLVNPELPYVVARYRRRDVQERIVVTKSAVGRLKEWLPGCEIEILEEKTGSELANRGYVHPLSLEYPPVAAVPAPAGGVLASREVGDSGTAIIGLVPAHGAADANAARALQVQGWPVVGSDGKIESDSSHKYAGLPVDTAESFILRDLADGGFVFAQLRVRRGVPHCDTCGTALLWFPMRLWSFEPGRLDPEHLNEFARLLPREPLPRPTEAIMWPASGPEASENPTAPALRECSDCDRLAPTSAPEKCECGGRRAIVRRSLLVLAEQAFFTWAAFDPYPTGDIVWLILPERRRVPVLLLHLLARAGLEARVGEMRITTVPTLVGFEEARAVAGLESRDVLRSALIQLADAGYGSRSLTDALVAQRRQLAKLWSFARTVTILGDAASYTLDSRPIASGLTELDLEDRGFLSLFERARREAILLLASGRFTALESKVQRELLGELRDSYLSLVGRRLETPGRGREAALRVLYHCLPLITELLAPIAPFTLEAVHRALMPETVSLFERRFTPPLEGLLDAKAEKAYRERRALVSACERGRRWLGIGPDVILPRVAVLLTDDKRWDPAVHFPEALAPLLGARGVDIVRAPATWEGRVIEARPNPAEIQRVYGTAAGRIAAILHTIPARRIREGVERDSLAVLLDGASIRILPSMIELIDRLPDNVAVLPWAGGEIYFELPPDAPPGPPERRVPLSPDARRVVERLRKRLARLPATDPRPAETLLFLPPALVSELGVRTALLQQVLGLPLVRVGSSTDVPVPAESFRGRTRRGEKWKVWLKGTRVRARPRKVRPHRPRSSRAPTPTAPTVPESMTDFADERTMARIAAVREIAGRFETELGVAVLGPSKLGHAWDAGLTSFDALAHAPYETLSAIPGFGPYLARAVVTHFGGFAPATIFTQRSRPLPQPPAAAPAVVSTNPAVPPVEAPAPSPPFSAVSQFAPSPAVPARDADFRVKPPPPTHLPTEREAVPESTMRTDSPPAHEAEPQPTPEPYYPPAPVAPEPPPPPPSAKPPAPASRPLPPWRPLLRGLAAPPAAPPSPPPSRPPPEGVQIWEGPSVDPAWDSFLSTTVGKRGLCITREFPHRIQSRIGSRDIEVVWLSNVGRDAAIRPSDLDGLRDLFRNALVDGQVKAILLEGLEYLVTIHSLAKILEMLGEVDSQAKAQHAIVYAPINTSLLGPGPAGALRAAFSTN